MMSSGAADILDGGMGHLLRRKGIEVKGPKGSLERFLGVAVANLETPHLVKEAHEEYLQAGATTITTNTYACVPGLMQDGGIVVRALREGGRIARQAADRFGAQVAGCLPPLTASCRPHQVLTDEALTRWYRAIAVEIAPFSDLLLCEAMSCAREAACAARAAMATGLPVWVSWALSEAQPGRLLSGETVQEAVAALNLTEGGPVKACLFSSPQPASIARALPLLRRELPSGVAIGGYANGLVTVASPGAGSWEYRTDVTPERYAECLAGWQDEGATILGGIFPEHISALADIATQRAALAPTLHRVELSKL